MPAEVFIPSLGEVVESAKILNWFKSEGDFVEKGENPKMFIHPRKRLGLM